MRSPVAVLCALVVVVSLAGCGSDGPDTGSDDGPAPASDPAITQRQVTRPTVVPAASGPVRSVSLPTVMDTGDGPELCLGAVAESYPPQCRGPEIVGWDWRSRAPHFDRQGDIRWGTFAVTGRWDGTTFTLTDAIPGALYDPPVPTPVELPDPSVVRDEAELDAVAAELQGSLPGVQGTTTDQAGHVLVDVTYDDGSLQDYVDDVYGAGAVVVRGALVDA